MRDNHYTKETVHDEVEIPGKIETIFLYVDQRNTLKRQLGLVAQRITRLTTDQKIAGSNPAEIDFFSNHQNCLFLCISVSNTLHFLLTNVYGHTTLNAPVLVRSLKLSNVGPS